MLKAFFITIFLGFILTTNVYGQDLPVHEQYMFDYMLINPAFVGMSEVTMVKMIHREQWVGIDNGPQTSFLLFKRRLKEKSGGLGGYLFSDKNGPNTKYGAQVSWSFQALLKSVRFSRSILSFGMSFRATVHVLDETGFENDIYDPIINYSKRKTFIPNANAGMMYSYNKFFVGVSFDNLLPWSDRMYDMSIEPTLPVFMNIHTGNIFQLTRRLQFRPSLVFKSNFNGLNQGDFNFKFHIFGGKQINSIYIRFPNEFWIGASYRQTFDWLQIAPLSFSPAMGFSVKAFSFMYLYDLGLTRLQLFHTGSHQICIGIRLFYDQNVNWGKQHIPLFTDDF